MRFCFNKIILWLDGGVKRELEFAPNKVNVITGGSGTGKSAILQIIDYCFFASKSKIPESIINENVQWYGVNISINEKLFTICRRALNQGKVSDDYCFSSLGVVPDIPSVNNDEATIKSILETEFGIDRNIRIPFGGKTLKAGAKISLRYFLMFTTISDEIIISSEVYFDKQNDSRYREALHRIFDLAVGIDDLVNILKREERAKKETELTQLEQKSARIDRKSHEFQKELSDISKRAMEFGLINSDIAAEDIMVALNKAVTNPRLQDETSDKYYQLKREEFLENKTIRNLKALKKNYEAYKRTLTTLKDSILPIEHFRKNNADLVRTSIYDEIMTFIEKDLASIRADLNNSSPIDVNINNILASHETVLANIRNALSSLSPNALSFKSEKEKYFFLGEIKAKLELYGDHPETQSDTNAQPQLEKLKTELKQLKVKDVSEARDVFISFLEEIIQQYISRAGDALENYSSYLAAFDYTKKTLALRKPRTDHVEHVGSSSNHMFLHLLLFLGLHEAMHRKDAQYVPSYLIMDQPSRPYWGDGEKRKERLDHSDEAKIRKAFDLLNSFVDTVTIELDRSCQLIVFEHVPPSTWDGLNNFHLVAEFTGDDALIPHSYLRENGS